MNSNIEIDDENKNNDMNNILGQLDDQMTINSNLKDKIVILEEQINDKEEEIKNYQHKLK